jgi:hypothetical protein
VANAFLKAEKIVSQGLGLLQRELILPRLVTRYGVADFAGAKNDTINIRIPSLLAGREYEWRTRTAPITVDELDETSIPIELNKHVYSAVGITDEELTLDITSWGDQVARPQIRDVEEAALQSPHLIKVDQAGNSDALRDAIIGRIAGFTVLGNVNSVPADFAVAFHPTAFALGNVAPVVPDGATAGATLVFDSLAMRWIRDYDSDYLRDRSVYSAFAGAASVEDGRDMDPESVTYGDLTDKNVRAVEIVWSGAGS